MKVTELQKEALAIAKEEGWWAAMKTWLIGQNCWGCPWATRRTVTAADGKKPKLNRSAQRTHEKATGHRVATGLRTLRERETT